ncbi:hypothetical protein IT413_03745 [Candidatus Peregrinibacteria bacterium]|nr:hypothetical protein [Candidatus Peregrinibacteria bacterium]
MVHLSKFYHWMDGLKNNKKSLLILIGVDIFLAVGSNIADWPWLSSVDWRLLLFAPICSLYPLVLAIVFGLKYLDKKVPAWLTTFIFMAIVSYGIMAYIYYPFYMSWDGVKFRLVGNIIWVTCYAIQSLILFSDIKKLPIYQYALIFGYFAAKDYSDRFLGSFIDILRPDFPKYLIDIFTVSMIVLHVTTASAVVAIPYLRKKKSPTQIGSDNAKALTPDLRRTMTAESEKI